MVLVLLSFFDFGISQALEQWQLHLYARPTFYFSLILPLLPLMQAVQRAQPDDMVMLIVFATATFYGMVCYQKGGN